MWIATKNAQAIVRSNAKVKVRGSAHSFNRIADTTGVAIRLDRLPREISIDAATMTTTVSAGLTYGDLATHLQVAGFALHVRSSAIFPLLSGRDGRGE